MPIGIAVELVIERRAMCPHHCSGLLYWAKVHYAEQLTRMATYESLNYDDRDSVRGVKEASRALTSTLVALLVTLLVYFCHLLLKLVFEIRWGLLLIPQPIIRCVACECMCNWGLVAFMAAALLERLGMTWQVG